MNKEEIIFDDIGSFEYNKNEESERIMKSMVEWEQQVIKQMNEPQRGD